MELPEPAVDAGADSDEEPAGEDEKYEQDDDDFLVEFPDETEVSPKSRWHEPLMRIAFSVVFSLV